MDFWGHTFYSFDEVAVPSGLNDMWQGQEENTQPPKQFH